MSKHTPGPWFLGDGGHLVLASSSECVAILCDAEGDQFASMTTHSGNTVTPEQRRANGVIMAEAPELLEALKALFEHCSMVHKHWGEGCNQREADAAIKAGRAAIQKAKGE